MIACFAGAAVGAAVGVAIIFAGPGTRLRAQVQGAGVGLTRLRDAPANNAWLFHHVLGWRVLPAVAIGLSMWALRGTSKTDSGMRWLIVWASFLLFVPAVCVAEATGYAGSQGAPYRAAFIATASIAAGAGVLAYLTVDLVVAVRPRLVKAVVPVALLTLAIGVSYFVNAAMPVIRAERLRAGLMASRAASISMQLRERRTVIAMVPAPLIDPST